jgi:uncharacterized membrane protein
MDLRLALLDLSAKHGLSAGDSAKLKHLAGLDIEPDALPGRLALGMGILGALLGGVGIIFWIAANWESLGRYGRFGLLEATVLVMCLGASRRPTARVPLSLVAFLACGGLFAYFGQTYQTGADPWQLFAWWAALTLPLCLGVRHQAIWTAWVWVALTACSLWSATVLHNWWQRMDSPLLASFATWVPALLLAMAFHPSLSRLTGTGTWPMRLNLTYATVMMSFISLESFFGGSAPAFYLVGLFALAGLGWTFSTRRYHDTLALSVIGLALNVMLVSGAARLMSLSQMHEPIFLLLVIGGGAAGLMAATVKYIVKTSREMAPGEASA